MGGTTDGNLRSPFPGPSPHETPGLLTIMAMGHALMAKMLRIYAKNHRTVADMRDVYVSTMTQLNVIEQGAAANDCPWETCDPDDACKIRCDFDII